ncbi:Putative peptidase S54, rhomboid domain, Rhomboid-like superfamily [Septoria linicola]|uniref:Peptidase S54, rhomboid domain, Rhomboid-like superfamily n=1 Tax=Septoria linicola TaxID=215465 RepID=A0A9Q9AIV8_9PEZI|nr:putative peptidase S54, rhomboid domain, Rhomboid-like superfamily [Septoria linicola]USW46716.1 Putative peptidase S54, rhomboid domain, Rhomboid-like superfamily [Septoria linicola]
MSNVWTSIACAVPRRQTRVSPLLQLFNGYAKSQSTRSFTQWSLSCHAARYDGKSCMTQKVTFSTSSCLAARPKKTASKQPVKGKAAPPLAQTKVDRVKTAAAASAAKLEPAPTIASHTEGLPDGEQLTWRDYDPEGGMPLPGGERSQAEINAIFNGEDVDVDTGNYILSVLHWRRMSGALIDVGLRFPRDIQVSKEQALQGLEYVRAQLPDVDEAGNGSLWAKEEEERLREEMQARAVKIGLYKPNEADLVQEEYDEIEESDQGTQEGRERTGASVLQATRQANENEYEQFKREQEEAKLKAQQNAVAAVRGPLELGGGVQQDVSSANVVPTVTYKDPRSGIVIRPPPSAAFLGKPREKPAYLKYYEEKATIIKDNVVPQMSTLARLGPSFLVLMLVLGGCWYLHENYTPPPTSARIWPDTPPAVATLGAITGLLATTFILGRLPPLWRTFNKYMTCSPAYPYPLSLIGACFRHDTVLHLTSNVITLWVFGLFLHEEVGRGTFLAIYLASGVTGTYASLVYNVLRKQWMVYVLGASNSVLGVTAAICTLRPTGSIEIFGYKIPVYAWMYLALISVTEVVAAVKALKTTIDHAGHVGGIIFGGASAFALRYEAAQRSPGGEESVTQMMRRDAKEVADELKREAKEADLA